MSATPPKGADPAEVTAFRHYIAAITKEERSQLTLQEFADSLVKWFASRDGAIKLGFQIAVIVGSWFGLLIVARVVRAWTRVNDRAYGATRGSG